MWHSMIHLDPSVLEKILRPILIYVFLIVAIRIGGHRELNQTSALQFVLLLSVANAVQNGIIGVDDSVTGAAIGAVTLFLVNGLVELVTSRSPRARQVIIGRPVELVRRGVVSTRELRRHRISTDDLAQAAVAAGGLGITDIEHAVLAADGNLVVSLKSSTEIVDRLATLESRIDLLIARLDG